MCAELDRRYPNLYRIPRYYREKPDFGDVDILLSSQAIRTDWPSLQAELVSVLGATQSQTRTELLSTVIDGFQVDFFLVPHEELDSNWHFLSFNDLGNLLGKIYRRFNLKYGKDGLSYVYRAASGNYRKDLLLSRDWPAILSFIELDYATWERGFATLEAMFDWVVSSRYFSVDPYLELNRTTRARAKRRQTMLAFVDYLTEKRVTQRYPFAEDRDSYLPKIAEYFEAANLPDQINEQDKRSARDRLLREKFGGEFVMSCLPHLAGKQLSEFMQCFRNQHRDFEAMILAQSQEQIQKAIVDFYQNDFKPR